MKMVNGGAKVFQKKLHLWLITLQLEKFAIVAIFFLFSTE